MRSAQLHTSSRIPHHQHEGQEEDVEWEDVAASVLEVEVEIVVPSSSTSKSRSTKEDVEDDAAAAEEDEEEEEEVETLVLVEAPPQPNSMPSTAFSESRRLTTRVSNTYAKRPIRKPAAKSAIQMLKSRDVFAFAS